MLTIPTVEELSKVRALFSYCWGNTFFIETPSNGNFIWSDPDYYGGDNTIKPYKGNHKDYLKEIGVPCSRYKGYHLIGEYCPNFELKEI